MAGEADAGVFAQAHGHGFDEYRPFAASYLLDHLLHAIVESHRVVAVELDPFEAVGFGAAGEVLAGGVLGNRRVFAYLVVLAEENHRQIPQPGQVHGLVDGADAGGAVTEVTDGDVAGAAHLVRQSQAVGDRGVAADDGGGQHRAGPRIGDVGGATLALVDAVNTPQRFGKQALEGDAFRNLVVDAPVDGEHAVIGGDQGGDGRGDALLPRHRPVSELELTAGQPRLNGLVHLVDPRHLAVDRQQGVIIDFAIL